MILLIIAIFVVIALLLRIKWRTKQSSPPSPLSTSPPCVFHIKNPPGTAWLQHIENGTKTVEGRKRSPAVRTLKPDDMIYLKNANRSVLCKITYINIYANIEEYLRGEQAANPTPGLDIDAAMKAYLVFGDDYYREFVGIGIKPVIKPSRRRPKKIF